MPKPIEVAQRIPDEIREEILSIGFLVKGVSKEGLERAIAEHGFFAEGFRTSGRFLWKKNEPYTRFMYCVHATAAAMIESGQAAKEGETPTVIAVRVEPYIDSIVLAEPQEIIPRYYHEVLEIRAGIQREDILPMVPGFYGLQCTIMDRMNSGLTTETMLRKRYEAIHRRMASASSGQ